MSTVPTPSTHASTAPAQAVHGKARHGATPDSGGDLFANLMALLSSTLEPATDTAPGADTAAADGPADALNTRDPAPDGSQNPLAALLGWTAAPALPGAPVAGNAPITATSNRLNANSATSLDATTAPGLPGAADATALASSRSTPTLSAFSSPAVAAGTPAQPGAAQAGVGQPGMVPLATPTAPDAQTLAALSRANGGAAAEVPAPEANRHGPAAIEAAPGTPANGANPAGEAAIAAPRSLHWRSTAGPAGSSTTATATATAAAGHAPAAESAQSARQALAAQSRSTVALDERFGQSPASQAPLATEQGAPVAAGARGAPQQDSGAGTPDGAPGQGGMDAAPDTPAASNPEAGAYAEATREPDEPGAAHWGTPSLRHASLRVGEAGEDAIDIQLSMAGQEVQVDFRTDNAEARASLAQDANGSLGDLLQRGGIQLGSVSVGAQHQQQGEPGRTPVPAPAAAGRGRATGESVAPAAPEAAPRPRADGSRPLDLFV